MLLAKEVAIAVLAVLAGRAAIEFTGHGPLILQIIAGGATAAGLAASLLLLGDARLLMRIAGVGAK